MEVAFVSFVNGEIFLDNVQPNLKKDLSVFGATARNNSEVQMSIKYSSEEEKITLFIALRDLHIAFSAGHDWSPAAQFEDFRDRGLITGKYLRIAWREPNNYKITEL
ncbi:MAG: hypothetical protein JXD23_10755 [Spirochaetales bacterium]|nr:hypothetical protein [Spirochaetales bacterium]